MRATRDKRYSADSTVRQIRARFGGPFVLHIVVASFRNRVRRSPCVVTRWPFQFGCRSHGNVSILASVGQAAGNSPARLPEDAAALYGGVEILCFSGGISCVIWARFRA